MTTSYLSVFYPGILKIMSPWVGVCLPVMGRAVERAAMSPKLLSCLKKTLLLRG